MLLVHVLIAGNSVGLSGLPHILGPNLCKAMQQYSYFNPGFFVLYQARSAFFLFLCLCCTSGPLYSSFIKMETYLVYKYTQTIQIFKGWTMNILQGTIYLVLHCVKLFCTMSEEESMSILLEKTILYLILYSTYNVQYSI